MLDAYQTLMDGHLSFAGREAQRLPDPIGIGAVGGSGTRLLRQILEEAGVAMASPWNKAGDAYEWPPFPRLLSDEMLAKHERSELMPNILHVFETLLCNRRDNLGLAGRAGWKVPGTLHWLQDLGSFFPAMQYLHLVRHGLDMAYSENQNQARKWAASLGVDLRHRDDGSIHPHSMLEYWLAANEMVKATAARFLPGRMLVVRFESLCQQPAEELQRIFTFLDIDLPATTIDRLATLPSLPASAGRYQGEPWREDFSETQLERLAALGYPA